MRRRRLLSAAVRAGGVVMSAAVLAACGGSGPVDVGAEASSPAAPRQCSDLLRALPDRVFGQDRRDVTPSDAAAAAWGDPPIVLRCGVGRPAALRRTSECLEVNHVFWLATQGGKPVAMTAQVHGTLVFTTIGRSVYVELSVPGGYQPPADALVDVAAAVSTTTDELRPCR